MMVFSNPTNPRFAVGFLNNAGYSFIKFSLFVVLDGLGVRSFL